MFDPFHKWLGISPSEQPPHHYRLLGIELFESDQDVINAAADKQLAFLHDMTNGEHAEIAEQISNQVSAARLCLLNEKKRRAYDEVLRGQLQRSSEPISRHPAQPVGTRAQPVEPVSPASAPTTAPRSPAPRVQKRRRSSAPSRNKSRSFLRFSTLLCIVALVMIGVGVRQGKIVLDYSRLEALGVTVPEQLKPSTEPVATSPPSTPAPAPTTNRPPTASADRAIASNPPDQPSAVSSPEQSAAPPTPSRPRRSGTLGDLVHPGMSTGLSGPVVKTALPSESQLEEKMALIRELYEQEYRAAKTRSDKIELAKLMHREGQKTLDDPIGRFALWRVARDILAIEGDYATALAIVDNLDKHYHDVDVERLKVETINNSAANVLDASRSQFISVALSTIAVCRQAEKFELASSVFENLEQKIGQTLSDTLLEKLQQANAELNEAESAFAAYQQAQPRLSQSEDDPDANSVTGHYLCFVRAEWQRGLPFLVKTDNPALRSAAEMELATPTTVADKIAVADAWFDLAESTTESFARREIHRHSLQWYVRARADAQGLDARRIDARIGQLERTMPDTGSPDRTGTTLPENVLGYRMQTSSISRSDSADRKGNTFTLGMGQRPDGRGEAMAGMELQGVTKLTVDGSASHQEMLEIDSYSKTGFVVDYHTPGGYARRVFLGCGLKPGRQFSAEPKWGTAKPPEIITDIGRSKSYEIDLERWAPSTWDGRCWFTIYMQNSGTGRTLFATVSW